MPLFAQFAMMIFPQFAAKSRNSPQNTLIRCNLPHDAAKRCKKPQFAAICRKTLLFVAICRKTPQNAAIRHKTPQFAAKCKSTFKQISQMEYGNFSNSEKFP